MTAHLDFDEINPHLGLWHSETYVSPAELAWEGWVCAVEKILGHDLDGNQDRDGYCLDYAYDAHQAGLTPAQHAAEIKDAVWALATPKVAQ